MQEKTQLFSPIKQNILKYIEYLNISKRNFYLKTQISRGTLESVSGITEETLTKFIATYPNVSLSWLILNQGEMLINETAAPKNEAQGTKPEAQGTKPEAQGTIQDEIKNKLKELQLIIDTQKETINAQRELINILSDQLKKE